jgi:hypothetical protein
MSRMHCPMRTSVALTVFATVIAGNDPAARMALALAASCNGHAVVLAVRHPCEVCHGPAVCIARIPPSAAESRYPQSGSRKSSGNLKFLYQNRVSPMGVNTVMKRMQCRRSRLRVEQR